MTRDPIGEGGGINLFAFVGNNPSNWIDPFGLVDLNLVPNSGTGLFSDAALRSFLDTLNYQPYAYSVGAHGSPNVITDENGKPMTPMQLACLMKENGYKGGPVVLTACSTGRGKKSFAQKLADELGADVYAPTRDLQPGLDFFPPFISPSLFKHFYRNR